MQDQTLDDMLQQYNLIIEELNNSEKDPAVVTYMENLDARNNLETNIKKYTKEDRDSGYQTEFWNVERQERKTITYDPDKIRNTIPDFADAVIEETVNKKKIDGLLKGELITSDQIKPAQDEKVVIAVSIRRSAKLKV